MQTRWVTFEEVEVPHRVTHPEKLSWLVSQFRSVGWDNEKPNLLGYPLDGRLQLVTGSHRSAAAGIVEIAFPVDVYPYRYMQEIWGTDE